MTALSRIALFSLLCCAVGGASDGLLTLAPSLPAELRGIVAASLMISAAALVMDGMTT